MVILLQSTQEVEVLLPPQNNVIIVVAGRHRPTNNQKQHLTQPVHHLAGLATVSDLRKILQKALGAWWFCFVHGFLPNHRKPIESHHTQTRHQLMNAVNLNSLTW